MKNISGLLALPIITTRVLQKHQRRLHNLVVVLLIYCDVHQEGRQPLLSDLNCPSTEDNRLLHPAPSIAIPAMKEILPDSQFFTISFFSGALLSVAVTGGEATHALISDAVSLLLYEYCN